MKRFFLSSPGFLLKFTLQNLELELENCWKTKSLYLIFEVNSSSLLLKEVVFVYFRTEFVKLFY